MPNRSVQTLTMNLSFVQASVSDCHNHWFSGETRTDIVHHNKMDNPFEKCNSVGNKNCNSRFSKTLLISAKSQEVFKVV